MFQLIRANKARLHTLANNLIIYTCNVCILTHLLPFLFSRSMRLCIDAAHAEHTLQPALVHLYVLPG